MTTEANPPWVAADIAAAEADYPAWLAAKRDDALQQVAGIRRTIDKAEASGLSQFAGTLGLLVTQLENQAAWLDAERRNCIAAQAKLQGGRKARASSIAARQRQADTDAAQVAGLFKSAWRDGMGRVKLQAAAVALIAEKEQHLRAKLITAQQVDNKRLQRQHSAELESLKRQTLLCTKHRAGMWLKEPRESG
jgi:hypothetical protein